MSFIGFTGFRVYSGFGMTLIVDQSNADLSNQVLGFKLSLSKECKHVVQQVPGCVGAGKSRWHIFVYSST